MRRILVTGDRFWADDDLIFQSMNILPMKTTIIEGAAPGADEMAHQNARRLGLGWLRFPAYWSCKKFEDDQKRSCALPDGRHNAVHGRPAGVIRNQRMLDESNPTEVWAFHDNLEISKGTADMVKRAQKAGLTVTHYSHDSLDGIVL